MTTSGVENGTAKGGGGTKRDKILRINDTLDRLCGMSCNWKKAYLVRLSKLNFHFSENGNVDIFFLYSPLFLQGRGKDIRWKITIKCDDVCVISKWGIHLCKAFSCLGGTSVEINLKDIEMKVHLWRFQTHCMQFLCFVSFSVKLSSFYLQNLIRTLILLKMNMCISEIKIQQMEKKKSLWHF